ncbi:hypothetical protein J6S55_01705 [Candidatus Saccharibacteria bacterium]|nr:hypothetical protein [Candidatus Saccharibacteria bacterium]
MTQKTRGGFTLIELSLSLVFIAILSLTVVLLIQNTTASYRRGLILNRINTVGMDLIDDFRSSVQNSPSASAKRLCEIYYSDNANKTNKDKCEKDDGNAFVSFTKLGKADNKNDMPLFGAFCTGTYTYVWNSGYFEKGSVAGTDPAVVNVNRKNSVDGSTVVNTISNIRLLKIYDDGRSICANTFVNTPNYPTPANSLDYVLYQRGISNQLKSMLENALDTNAEGGIELLKKETYDLVLYDLYVSPPATSDTRRNTFYSASFILGTTRGGADITAIGNNCKPPADANSELDYCAINKFNFAVRAGGE